MDQFKIDPPYAKETTPNQRASILAELQNLLSGAALRMDQTRGTVDVAAFALIAGDLFDRLVDTLEVQVRTVEHAPLFDQIISWSIIWAKQWFPDHQFISQEIDARSQRRLASFREDMATRFSKNVGSSEVRRDLGSRLNDFAHRQKITHEELAKRIEVSRSTYFELKKGRGSERSRQLAEEYLSKFEAGTVHAHSD